MSHPSPGSRLSWPTLVAALLLAVALLLAWQQGWNHVLLGTLALIAASTGFLVRHTLSPELPPADTTPEDPDTHPERDTETAPERTLPDIRMVPQRWLQLSQELASRAQQAQTLTEAMSHVGARLHQVLGARAWHCLKVEDWNGQSGLLRPWMEFDGQDDDHIDLGVMAPVEGGDQPLGQSLVDRHPVLTILPQPEPPSDRHPWRGAPARQILAVPVFVGGRPLAVLEYLDPQPMAHEAHTLLQLAVIQLSFVAQRDESLNRAADSAAHLERLGLVASRISSGVALLDRHGVIEWVNPHLTALTGWRPERVLGHRLSDALARSQAEAGIVTQVQQHIAQGGPFRCGFECVRTQSDGHPQAYWCEIDAILTVDDTGATGHYVCLFNDISEQKTLEIQQSQEKEFLEALMGNLPVSLIVMDARDLSVVAINKYTELELGLNQVSSLRKPIADVVGPAVMEAIAPRMRQALDDGETVEHDFAWPSDSGMRIVNARHFALRGTNGAPRLLITLARDITVAQRATADLEESERRFRELVESMDDGVYVATSLHRQFLYHSPHTADILGVSPASRNAPDQGGSPLLDNLVLPDDRPALALTEQQCEREEPTDLVFRIQHPIKGLRWVRRRTRSRRLDDGSLRVYGLMSDVTDDRERSEELQRARVAAENASQAKSQFMASMSHEIRTPMNAILGMTELMLASDLDAIQRKQAQIVFRSGEQLLEIINDILDFSKIEAGRQELAPIDFALNTLIDDTVELLAPRAHEKGLEVTAHVQPGLPPMIHADSLRIGQVLTNLVGNAIKFTESGEVVVTVGLSEPIDPNEQLDVGDALMLTFSVRDTGIGIHPEVLPRLFNAFTQANAGLSRRYGGTGLGLAICKQLVELMGGQIEARSSPGMGSEFVFQVPVQVAAGESIWGLLDDAELPAMHVLVVDDNATNLTVIENLLTAWGMQVTLARDGQEALELLTQTEQDLDIDLALVDMKMPRMNGLEFARAVRSSRRYAKLKMVMLSSISTLDDVQLALRAGYERFLSKPVRKLELRQALLGVSSNIAPPTVQTLKLGLNVLVVEDNSVNQELCSQMLRRLGCRATVAGSAIDGLRKLTQERFDVVLMDIQMPGMDGTEALQVFRRNRHQRFNFLTRPDTPVVAVTAHALDGDDLRFASVGFDAYLSKPFRIHQLAKVLQTVAHLQPPEAMPPEPSVQPQGLTPVSEKTQTLRPTPHMTTSSAQPTSWREVFDEIAVQRLLELDPAGRNALIDRIIKMFATSVDKYLVQLASARQAQDRRAIRDVAHTLKSSSANVGALKLSQICVEIENAIRDDNGQPLEPMIERLEVEARHVVAALPLLLEASR